MHTEVTLLYKVIYTRFIISSTTILISTHQSYKTNQCQKTFSRPRSLSSSDLLGTQIQHHHPWKKIMNAKLFNLFFGKISQDSKVCKLSKESPSPFFFFTRGRPKIGSGWLFSTFKKMCFPVHNKLFSPGWGMFWVKFHINPEMTSQTIGSKIRN